MKPTDEGVLDLLVRRLRCLLGSDWLGDRMALAVLAFNAGVQRDKVMRTDDGVAVSIELLGDMPGSAVEALQRLRQNGALRIFGGPDGRPTVFGDVLGNGAGPSSSRGFVILAPLAKRLGFVIAAASEGTDE